MKNAEPEYSQTTGAAQAVGVQMSHAPEQALRAENEQLKEENARLKEELRREHEMYVRNLADFDNYRRRVERERAQAAQAGKRELILPLLEVLDDFARALPHAPDNPQSLAAGLHAIQRRLSNLLAAQGVTSFESQGQPFNPLLHEAIEMVEREANEAGTASGTVVDEVSRGWRWGSDLLRPARVRVAQ